MAVLHSFRSLILISLIVQLFSLFLLTNAAPSVSSSSPLTPLSQLLTPRNAQTPPSRPPTNHVHQLIKRERYILGLNTEGNLTASDPKTRLPLLQSPASDGAGAGFDAPAVLWLVLCAVAGFTMLLGGMKMGRFAAGVGIGAAASLAVWPAIINTMSTDGLSDLAITLVVIAFFIAGLVVGLFRVGQLAGMCLLPLLAGFSIGIRIVLLKPQLLVAGETRYAGNWAIIGMFGLVLGGWVLWGRTQRLAVAFGCAGVGSFLAGLTIDLAVKKQSGWSWGLRFLCDRNSAHIVNIIGTGYHPTATTQRTSRSETPIFAYAQHRLFPGPFLSLPSPSYLDPTMGRFVAETETIDESELEKASDPTTNPNASPTSSDSNPNSIRSPRAPNPSLPRANSGPLPPHSPRGVRTPNPFMPTPKPRVGQRTRSEPSLRDSVLGRFSKESSGKQTPSTLRSGASVNFSPKPSPLGSVKSQS
ncbi:hypothetical protein DFP72DRAFT_880112 [Ephemerocybe angulata]|uniref:DUF4203 domain-containing protein n=1 Tax=Ephemerocybe angulata TaxID=980116 RepID=A0A8H6IB91_9AGAR|nr:hypothetical protein DFP72DRAFT_880112 [Tulosesus angulatus]